MWISALAQQQSQAAAHQRECEDERPPQVPVPQRLPGVSRGRRRWAHALPPPLGCSLAAAQPSRWPPRCRVRVRCSATQEVTLAGARGK